MNRRNWLLSMLAGMGLGRFIPTIASTGKLASGGSWRRYSVTFVKADGEAIPFNPKPSSAVAVRRVYRSYSPDGPFKYIGTVDSELIP